MGDNPYQRDVELSPRWQWLGGAFFAAAIAAPFAVMVLAADRHFDLAVAPDMTPPEGPKVRLTETTGPVAKGRAFADLAPDTIEQNDIVLTAVGIDLPSENARARGAKRPALPGHRANLKSPRAVRDGDRVPAASTDAIARAPRIVPALANAIVPKDATLPALLVFETPKDVERAMELDQAKRREVQLRLTLMGYPTNGVDGIFGDQTRAAITSAQRAFGLPVSGYLDAGLLSEIEARTNAKLAAHRKAAVKRKAKRRLALAQARQPKARNGTKCRRGADGAIKGKQSFRCDWALMEESISSLFGSDG